MSASSTGKLLTTRVVTLLSERRAGSVEKMPATCIFYRFKEPCSFSTVRSSPCRYSSDSDLPRCLACTHFLTTHDDDNNGYIAAMVNRLFTQFSLSICSSPWSYNSTGHLASVRVLSIFGVLRGMHRLVLPVNVPTKHMLLKGCKLRELLPIERSRRNEEISIKMWPMVSDFQSICSIFCNIAQYLDLNTQVLKFDTISAWGLIFIVELILLKYLEPLFAS